jgi:hypothetical protein
MLEHMSSVSSVTSLAKPSHFVDVPYSPALLLDARFHPVIVADAAFRAYPKTESRSHC